MSGVISRECEAMHRWCYATHQWVRVATSSGCVAYTMYRRRIKTVLTQCTEEWMRVTETTIWVPHQECVGHFIKKVQVGCIKRYYYVTPHANYSSRAGIKPVIYYYKIRCSDHLYSWCGGSSNIFNTLSMYISVIMHIDIWICYHQFDQYITLWGFMYFSKEGVYSI